MGYLSNKRNQRPSTAPGILVSTSNDNTSFNEGRSTTSSHLSPPASSSNDSSSGGEPSTMGFLDFLSSAPLSEDELKIERRFGEGSRRREISSSRPSSAGTTSSSVYSPRSSTASSSKVRFSFPRSMSTSSSLLTSESERPLTPNGAVETFGFIRLQTLSGGICFIADTEGGKKKREEAVEMLEDVQVDVEKVEDEVEEVLKLVKRSPSIISRSSTSSKNWTPPSKSAPPTPTSTLSRANSSVPASTRLSILVTPPPSDANAPTPSNLVVSPSLRDLPNPPSAWKPTPPTPKTSSFIRKGGRRVVRFERGGDHIDAAVALLAASQEHGHVLRRLGLGGVEAQVQVQAMERDWVIVAEEEVAVQETKAGGRSWFGGGGKLKVKAKANGKGKKGGVAKKSSEERLSFLGREFGARAPFYVV